MTVVMRVIMARMSVINATQWNPLEKCVQAKPNQQADWDRLLFMMMRVSVLDASRQVLEHQLQKKPDQDERTKVGTTIWLIGIRIFLKEYFRQ